MRGCGQSKAKDFSTASLSTPSTRLVAGHTARVSNPFLYYADDRLSLSELCAARLDGHLVEVGDAYTPADTVETAALRAGSLRGLVGDLLAATHLSAAWIHGAISDPPARHTVQRAVSRRIHFVIHRRLHYRDLQIESRDLVRIGSVPVSSPVRTVADLARQPDAEHRHALDGFLAADPTLARAAVRWLEDAGRMPNKISAIQLLRSYADELSVTTR